MPQISAKIVKIGRNLGLASTGFVGFLAFVWLIVTGIAQIAGVTLGLSKLPTAIPIWQQIATSLFLASPWVPAIVLCVALAAVVALIYLPTLIALHKLDDHSSLNRWSISVDRERSIIGVIGPESCYLIDVRLSNASTTQPRVLDFRLHIPYGDTNKGSLVLSTESSRTQPYRSALLKARSDKAPNPAADRLLPLPNPINVPAGGHIEGRIEFTIPDSISNEIASNEHGYLNMFDVSLEVIESRSGMSIKLNQGQGWDAVKGQTRPNQSAPQYG